MSTACRLIHATLLHLSCVLLAWVPVIHAMAATVPYVRHTVRKEWRMMVAAAKAAKRWRVVFLAIVLTMLLPVFMATCAIDAAPVLWRNLRMQWFLWVEGHRVLLRARR
jgi:hypothetical protein